MNKTTIFTLTSLFTFVVIVLGYSPNPVQAKTIICPPKYFCPFEDGVLPSSTDTSIPNDLQINDLFNTVSNTGNVVPASGTATSPTSSYTSYTPSTSAYSPYTPINQTNNGTAACPMFTQTLRLGNNGTAVSALQTWLMNKGYAIASIATGKNQKGYYGYETYTALGKYQKAVGLRVTGVLDTATMNKINGSCASSVNTQGVTPVVTQQTGAQTQAEKDAAVQAEIQAAVAQYRANRGR